MATRIPVRLFRCTAARPPAAAAFAAAVLLTACASGKPAVPPPEEASVPVWTEVVVPEDRERLRRLPEAWTTALAQAREAGYAPELEALGPLADPAAALPDPAPRPGRYRCRTIKIGSQSGLLAFVAYSWFECEVSTSGELLRLDKLTGSQRQHGTLYPDTEHRLVFVGTLALGSGETAAPTYGADPERNVVGVMQRIGPGRWRLVQPWPRYESLLDLLVLEPVQDQGQ